MEPSVEELRKNYERFDDKKLIRIATEEASSLRPEALALIKQVIKERGLSEDILNAVDVQFKPVDEKTLLSYTNLLRDQPCPVCNATSEKLNATMTGTVISFVIMSSYRKELKIACPTCLDKQNNNAMIKSALFGWWGFPWGLIRTPQALLLNSKMKKQNHYTEANDLLNAYTLNNIGRIEANRSSADGLSELVKYVR